MVRMYAYTTNHNREQSIQEYIIYWLLLTSESKEKQSRFVTKFLKIINGYRKILNATGNNSMRVNNCIY